MTTYSCDRCHRSVGAKSSLFNIAYVTLGESTPTVNGKSELCAKCIDALIDEANTSEPLEGRT